MQLDLYSSMVLALSPSGSANSSGEGNRNVSPRWPCLHFLPLLSDTDHGCDSERGQLGQAKRTVLPPIVKTLTLCFGSFLDEPNGISHGFRATTGANACRPIDHVQIFYRNEASLVSSVIETQAGLRRGSGGE